MGGDIQASGLLIPNNTRAWIMEIKASNLSMAILVLALHKLIGRAKLKHILQNSVGNDLTGLNVIAF